VLWLIDIVPGLMVPGADFEQSACTGKDIIRVSRAKIGLVGKTDN
jgi:hypothetical protein